MDTSRRYWENRVITTMVLEQIRIGAGKVEGYNLTYRMEMLQFLEEYSAAKSNKGSPIIATAGPMVRGVMYLRRSPMRPQYPIIIWKTAATQMEPWISRILT